VPFVWYATGAPGFVYGVVAAAIVLVKHRANLARLSAGTESVLPLFGRGKRRVQGPPSSLG
jgi:glycerol-3-phosphate acyltransferase PlsY